MNVKQQWEPAGIETCPTKLMVSAAGRISRRSSKGAYPPKVGRHRNLPYETDCKCCWADFSKILEEGISTEGWQV